MSMMSRTAYSTWTPQKPTLFDGHYLRNRSTLDIGVFGYIGIVQHKEHSPKVLSILLGHPAYSEMMWTGKKVLEAYLKVHGTIPTGHSASPGFLQHMLHAFPLEFNFSLIRILLVTTVMLDLFSLTYLVKRLQMCR